MDSICFIVLFPLSLSPWSVSSKVLEINVQENGAANFYLPASRDCGQYNLIDPDGAVVLTMFPDASPMIRPKYSNRSTANELDNGTMVYTLHYITWRDEGTFMTQSLHPDCMWYSTVSILKGDSRIAFWETWNSWSRCGVSCGPGLRIRERECSIQGRCHGISREEEICNSEFNCPSWGVWGSWSICSVSCGRGEVNRHRQCHSDVGKCVGESSQSATCTLQLCADWATWSAWSSCSSSCDLGHASRRRQCMVGRDRALDSHCTGQPTETTPCALEPCKIQAEVGHTDSPDQRNISSVAMATITLTGVPGETSVDKKNTETPVPLTTIVGGAVAGFIIILLLVIIVLLVRMKRRKETTVRRRTIQDLANRQSKQMDTRAARPKSNAGRSETESRMYAEIDSEFLDSEFDATSCNDYGPLPSSASPHGTGTDQSTVGGNIFVFDTPAVSYPAHLGVPKISSGISPRQGNVGRDGYEKPITCSDRQRKMAYANVEYSNVIR